MPSRSDISLTVTGLPGVLAATRMATSTALITFLEIMSQAFSLVSGVIFLHKSLFVLDKCRFF
ncbi:MAG: hypothetical protein A2486_07585 [Burkholderiales bacterium RIFOXYC12_FULL_65_23]|nr:MAG: hypothetical protein A2486_07585 [Burkholderiales bacterium RIFOXYC12_FULL_65_23]